MFNRVSQLFDKKGNIMKNIMFLLVLLGQTVWASDNFAMTRQEFVQAFQEKPKTRGIQPDRGVVGIVQDQRPSVNVLIHFDYNSATIKNDSEKLLKDIANAFQNELKDSVFIIAGHTDSDGSENYNIVLSQKRANSIRNFLLNQGVNYKQMRTEAFGKSKPIADNNTEIGKAKNRRVEFIRIGRLD